MTYAANAEPHTVNPHAPKKWKNSASPGAAETKPYSLHPEPSRTQVVEEQVVARPL